MKKILTILAVLITSITYSQTWTPYFQNVDIYGQTKMRDNLTLEGNEIQNFNFETVDTIPNVANANDASILFNLEDSLYYEKYGSVYIPVVKSQNGDFVLLNSSINVGLDLPFIGFKGKDYGTFINTVGIVDANLVGGGDISALGWVDFANQKFNAVTATDTSNLEVLAHKDLSILANEDLLIQGVENLLIQGDSLINIQSFGNIRLVTTDTIIFQGGVKAFTDKSDSDWINASDGAILRTDGNGSGAIFSEEGLLFQK